MLMVRKIVLSIVAVLALSFSALAQNQKVTGTVKDDLGRPIVGATVFVDGTSIGVTTNMDGDFALQAPANGTLLVSFIGYEGVRVEIAGKSKIDVVLHEDTQAIDEVVVTGYGVQRKASFTGAAAVLDNSVLEKKSDANFVKALEGSVPGVQMNNSTGIPGAWGSIYVRGRGSLSSGSAPLYVIDGMPVNSDADALSSSNNVAFDPMAAINPADIESITVLKDAAATAIYGSRASNGVIVVTTKQGSQGKFNIDLNIKQGFTDVANNNMEYANAAQAMDLFARGYSAYYKVNGRELSYDDAVATLSKNYGWDGESSYDWFDKVTRKGYYQDYNVSASGSSGKVGYFASLGYLNTKGIVINSDMERFSGRLNLNSKFKYATLGVNTSFSHSIQDGFSQSTGGSMTNPTVGAITQMKPFYPFYNEDGSYNTSVSYNPLAVQDEKLGDMSRVWNSTININPYIQFDFGKGIYAKSTLGVNISHQREYSYWSAVYNNQGMGYNGLGQEYITQNAVITWNNVLGWNYTFGDKHDVSVMVGQEMQRKYYQYEYLCGSDFPYADNGMRDLSTAGSWMDSEFYKSEATLASYFVDAHYTFNDRVYVSGSFRRDGSSAFGADKRWGNFWSLGAKYRFSEDFFSESEVFTNAALRASYGTVGNQDIGWYAARGFYVAGSNYAGVPGMTPSGISNRQLTWETSKKFDVGVEFSLVDRVHVTLDYYNEITEDALYSVPMSQTTGMSSATQNIGSVRNSGIEFSVNATIMQKKNFVWNAYANLSWNKNEVVKLNGEPVEGTLTMMEEGRPFNTFRMKEWAGVDPETGMPQWYLNETGNEVTSDYNAAAKRYVGEAQPKVVGGFGTDLKWKGLDFNIAFTYRMGGKVYDYGARFTGFGMVNYTPHVDMVNNSWTPENKNAKYAQYIYSDPFNATADSTLFLYDADYLKISNITLGYTLPSKWTKKAMIEKFRVYVSLENPYIFTAKNFIGYTPETYSDGLISWQHPAVSTYTAGIQITF